MQVVGSALSDSAVSLAELPLQESSPPVIIVLGNEGHGIRSNVLNRCDVLVKLHSGSSSSGGNRREEEEEIISYEVESNDPRVDSLNVSVAGGILMHYFLGKRRR